MSRDYDAFVADMQQILMERLGLNEEQVFFKKEDENGMTPDGDRLFVECNASEGGKEVCGIHISELFENYEDGVSFEKIVSTVEKEIHKLKNAGFFEKTRHLADYEKVKNDLFIRLLNGKRHKKELSHAVYRVVGDIALVLYMQVGELNGCTSSMKIRKECLESWKKDADMVFETALVNTYFVSPPRLFFWEKLICNPDYNGECFMDLNREVGLRPDSMGNCLSTARRTNGAVAIFLPGVAQRLAKMMDADFYMAFTSIHEVMIHNADRTYPEDLENILRETIREATPEEDFLTDKVYRYCRETGDFLMYKGTVPLELGMPHWEK